MDQFGRSQKIVIVEDNNALAEIYKTRLDILGYKVTVAYDGITALNVIEKEHPDLVLLDLMVPKIAGDQILETMRKSEWGRDIPVFIISNLNESDAPAGLRGMGIEGYAVKANLSNDQLDQLVDSILTPPGQGLNESLESSAAPAATVENPVNPDDQGNQDNNQPTEGYQQPQEDSQPTEGYHPPQEDNQQNGY
jgi:DNA-binding response OmpR family regulator